MADQIIEQSKEIDISLGKYPTYVVVVAINRDNARNTITRLSCGRGKAIGGYVYDTVSDCYSLDCSDYLPLGEIPVSMNMSVSGISNWKVSLPLAPSVLESFLTETQKIEIKNFKRHYNSKNYYFEYVQMVGGSDV